MMANAMLPNWKSVLTTASTVLGVLLLGAALLVSGFGTHIRFQLFRLLIQDSELLSCLAGCFLSVGLFLRLSTLAHPQTGSHSKRLVPLSVIISCVGIGASAYMALAFLLVGNPRAATVTKSSTEDGFSTEQTLIEIHTLTAALVSYHAAYGGWPFEVQTNADTVVPQEAHSILVTNILARYSPGTFSGVFVGMRTNSFAQGRLLDSWGHPYHIVVDTDGDGGCTVEGTGRFDGRNVVVWSDGPGRLYLK